MRSAELTRLKLDTAVLPYPSLTLIFIHVRLILVTLATVVGLLYRLATLTPEVRRFLLRGSSRLADGSKVDLISRRCYVGDWFMLYLLGM